MKPMTDEIRRAAIEAARAHTREGSIEVDESPDDPKELALMVSECPEWEEEGGVYVKAWVWVSTEEFLK